MSVYSVYAKRHAVDPGNPDWNINTADFHCAGYDATIRFDCHRMPTEWRIHLDGKDVSKLKTSSLRDTEWANMKTLPIDTPFDQRPRAAYHRIGENDVEVISLRHHCGLLFVMRSRATNPVSCLLDVDFDSIFQNTAATHVVIPELQLIVSRDPVADEMDIVVQNQELTDAVMAPRKSDYASMEPSFEARTVRDQIYVSAVLTHRANTTEQTTDPAIAVRRTEVVTITSPYFVIVEDKGRELEDRIANPAIVFPTILGIRMCRDDQEVGMPETLPDQTDTLKNAMPTVLAPLLAKVLRQVWSMRTTFSGIALIEQADIGYADIVRMEDDDETTLSINGIPHSARLIGTDVALAREQFMRLFFGLAT